MLFVAAAPVSDLARQSFGNACPGFAEASQRMSLLATWLFLLLTFDLSPVPVMPVPAVVLPLYDELREDLSLSLIGLGLSMAVPLPLEGRELPLPIEVEGMVAVLLPMVVLPVVLDVTEGAAPGRPSFAPVPPVALADVEGTDDGALVVCGVESMLGDFLFLFMSPMASADALPSRMTVEKNTGAILRMRNS